MKADRQPNQRLTPLADIPVPDPRPDQTYTIALLDREVRFEGLKKLLGAADVSKAGDRYAGLAAKDEVQREAARQLLSSLPLQHFYDHPLLDDDGRVDAVMRVSYDIDRQAFGEIASMTLGELKDHLCRSPGTIVARIGRGLTAVMAAALAKICDTHELIYLAQKIRRPTKARTQLGGPGVLATRLQPNHPSDDLKGIALLIFAGLSMGSGDALIAVNPAIDTIDNVDKLLRLLDRLRRQAAAPTQICVLGHIKTQLACLERGAPVEILFQSIAGTERTNLEEFDITVELLDEAWQTMARSGPLRDEAEQFMYFETGQGSELTYAKHNGLDMTTCEALCYALARRYDPFMVNNVTGFIGPETHLDSFEMIQSNLQDHFMGKLLGLPMGMAPCYTLHSRVTLDGQQMATQLLTAAGANFYMDVHLNTDRMLAYFDTSGHDDQTLREIYGRTPTPAYVKWTLERGIFERNEAGQLIRGPRWGDPRLFCDSEQELQELIEATPAIYGFDSAGPRPTNAIAREVRAHQAIARQAIYRELSPDELGLEALGIEVRALHTRAASKEAHLGSADLGAKLSAESAAMLRADPARRVRIALSDGLSAEAVLHNARELVPVLRDGLVAQGHDPGTVLFCRYGRVKLAEELAERLAAELIVLLIGERPGGDAKASRSLSAYLVYRLPQDVRAAAARFSNNQRISFEYTVISNIYDGSLPPIEAGSVIAERVEQILRHRAAGNRLVQARWPADRVGVT